MTATDEQVRQRMTELASEVAALSEKFSAGERASEGCLPDVLEYVHLVGLLAETYACQTWLLDRKKD